MGSKINYSDFMPYEQTDASSNDINQTQINQEHEKEIDYKMYQPYETEPYTGGSFIPGIKSGIRETTRIVPAIGKAYEEAQKTPFKEKGFFGKTVSLGLPATQVDKLLWGSSKIYDINPSFFGRSYAQKELEEGRPIPEEIQKSLKYKTGEFLGMDLPFLAIDIASFGGSKIFRHGILKAGQYGLKRLGQKEAYFRGANLAAGQTVRPALAASISGGLEDLGVPETVANLIGIPSGYYAIPKFLDKAGIYVLEKATKSILKKQSAAAANRITPTFANVSEGAATEVALGSLQKDFSTRNIMKDFVSKQDKEFGDSLLTIISADKAIVDEAENFLTDVLEQKSDILATEESKLAQDQTQLGEQIQGLQTQQKALETKEQQDQEALRQLLEENIPIQKFEIEPQRKQIIQAGAETLPDTEMDVSDSIINDAGRKIKANALTSEDQEASKLIENIPITKEAPQQATENIYNSISPPIGQPEAGQLYKTRREQAYALANQEKRELYNNLQKQTENSKYEISFEDFNKLTSQLKKMINNLEKLSFRSPTQERALDKLTQLNSSFDNPNEFIQIDNSIEPKQDIPTILKLWEVRKSLGQGINWASNVPGEKILKNEYNKFNKLLEKELDKAGLLDLYNEANQVYINRFLPLEQGSNGRVKYSSPEQAGKILNLEAIEAMEPFIKLEDLNPLRRHAIEKVIGHPELGKLNYRQLQKIRNISKYLTPNEQALFHALSNMPLIQAKVSTNQLGKIEKFLVENRSNLSKNVISELEKVIKELRSRADLPIEYITGRTRLSQLENIAEQQYLEDIEKQKMDRLSLQREIRKQKQDIKEQISDLKEQEKNLVKQSRELEKKSKNIRREIARLQKSLLSTMLQKDTNTALLNEMSTIDGIRNVHSMLGNSPQAIKIFEGLKQLKAQQIFNNATSINLIVKLLKNENSKRLLKELLMDDQYKRLYKLSELAQKMQEKLRYYINHSNTAVQKEHKKIFTDFLKGVTGSFIKGGITTALSVSGKFLLTSAFKRSLAQFLTDPKGLKMYIDFLNAMNKKVTSKATLDSGDRFLKYLLKMGYINPDNQQEETNSIR